MKLVIVHEHLIENVYVITSVYPLEGDSPEDVMSQINKTKGDAKMRYETKDNHFHFKFRGIMFKNIDTIKVLTLEDWFSKYKNK